MFDGMKLWWRRWMLNPKAKVIARSMKREPQAWTTYHIPEVFTLDHGNLKVWVGNGWWFVAIYEPEKEKLGLIGRTLVWWLAYTIRARLIKQYKQGLRFPKNENAVQALEK